MQAKAPGVFSQRALAAQAAAADMAMSTGKRVSMGVEGSGLNGCLDRQLPM